MRAFWPWMAMAMALAREVFPVPGTSSSRRWPLDNRQASARRTARSLPRIARPTEATILSKVSANLAACSSVMVMVASRSFGRLLISLCSWPVILWTGHAVTGRGDPSVRITEEVLRLEIAVSGECLVREGGARGVAVEAARDRSAEVGEMHFDVRTRRVRAVFGAGGPTRSTLRHGDRRRRRRSRRLSCRAQ